jgi:hypothetical protein
MDETTEQTETADPKVMVWFIDATDNQGVQINVARLQAKDIVDAVSKFAQQFPGFMVNTIRKSSIYQSQLDTVIQEAINGEESYF